MRKSGLIVRQILAPDNESAAVELNLARRNDSMSHANLLLGLSNLACAALFIMLHVLEHGRVLHRVLD